LLVTPNAKRFERIYAIFLKAIKRIPYKYPLNPDHAFEYSLSDLEGLLKNSRFKFYEVKPIFMKLSKFLRFKRYCNQFLVRAKKLALTCEHANCKVDHNKPFKP